MTRRLEDRLADVLGAWVEGARRHARAIVTVNAIATLVLAVYTALTLGVNTDNKRLIDDDLPFRRAAAAFERYFPSLDDTLLIVLDGQTPELAREGAQALARRLRAEPARFTDAYVIGGGKFFEEHGLLYRTPAELDDFVDQLARMQPVIADLSRDGTIANLARLIRLGLEEQRESGAGDPGWPAVLDRIGEATVRVFDEYPVSLSWERLMLEGSALDPGTRQVVAAEPILAFDRFLAARPAMAAVRAAAADLGLEPARGVRVRITGNPALNHEEMYGIAWDIGASGVLSFTLVTWLLFVALRSLRLVGAAALTLLVGLVWTAAFAAAAVGTLNVLSISFGVLFIGLGVDFAIHLGMHWAEAVQRGIPPRAAYREVGREIGTSLVLCAVTTAIGFFAFVPTDYRGVAELGLISGAGMFIILVQTLTFFPALIAVRLGDEAARRVRPSVRLHLAPPAVVARHPGAVVGLALVLAAATLPLLPQLGLDANVVRMRDPGTESVQAFNDLLAESRTSPWHANVLAPDLATADRVAARLRALDAVQMTLTLSDYVPADQEEKREILADAALIFDVPPAAPRHGAAPGVDEQIAALRELHGVLDQPWLRDGHGALAASARQLDAELARFLARVAREDDPSAALADLERILLGSLPAQVARLRRALEPEAITPATLPDDLRRRMLAADGHARVQVFPRADLSDSVAFMRFVDEVRAIEPEATGVSVNLVEFARATERSLREALLLAFLAIATLLLLLWGRVMETLLVLAPLVLAGVLIAGSMVLLGIPFNFANVPALPLLLGIGVDSGIHLVHQSRTTRSAHGDLLETTTARAVFFSAATTIASFGSLGLSAHRGIASMGVLLVCGMLLTLLCNLVFLPALLALREGRRTRTP